VRSFKDVSDFVRVKNAYRSLKETRAGLVILRDLAKTCNAASTTFDKDPHKQSFNAGKRQVWLRIQNMINVPDDELWKMENTNE